MVGHRLESDKLTDLDPLQTGEQERDPEKLVGTVLRDEFRLDALLGSGGMSHVFRARQLTVDRDVVVKVMMPPPSGSGEWHGRFIQEARAASRVSHPGIVTIFSFGEQDGVGPFIAMELVEGKPLRNLLRRDGIDPVRACGLMAQICRAMHAAHEAGVVHRDLKPDNVMIERRDGREVARVLDFGIAKPSDALVTTLDEHVVGTPDYMAPEQARKNPIDARTDVYSAGIILYEMVFGRRPFDAPEPLALMFKHVNAPLPLDEFDPAWPPELRIILETACAKDPDDRFESARAMADALDKVANSSAAAGTLPEAPDDSLDVVPAPVATPSAGPDHRVATSPILGRGDPEPEDVQRAIPTALHAPVDSGGRLTTAALATVIVLPAVVALAVIFWPRDDDGEAPQPEPVVEVAPEPAKAPTEDEGADDEGAGAEVASRAGVSVHSALSRAVGVAEGVALGKSEAEMEREMERKERQRSRRSSKPKEAFPLVDLPEPEKPPEPLSIE